MHVCNISFQVTLPIQAAWIDWMKTNFLPQLHATHCFTDIKWYQLEITEDQNPTYTLQLYTVNKDPLDLFHSQHATPLLQALSSKWGEQCLYFSTNMQIVN